MVPDVWILDEVLALLIALAAGTAAATALGRLRPVRWLGRQLVGQPVTEWLARVVAEMTRAVVADELEPIRHRQQEIATRTEQLATNGGSSLLDLVRKIDQRTEVLEKRTEKLTTRLTAAEDRIDVMEHHTPDPKETP